MVKIPHPDWYSNCYLLFLLLFVIVFLIILFIVIFFSASLLVPFVLFGEITAFFFLLCVLFFREL